MCIRDSVKTIRSVYTERRNVMLEMMEEMFPSEVRWTKPQGGMAFGKSPEGKSYVFKHVGAYDDIDTVYEAITAWLDEKGLTAKGSFVEEYLNEPQGSDDAKLELNIYVFVQ